MAWGCWLGFPINVWAHKHSQHCLGSPRAWDLPVKIPAGYSGKWPKAIPSVCTPQPQACRLTLCSLGDMAIIFSIIFWETKIYLYKYLLAIQVNDQWLFHLFTLPDPKLVLTLWSLEWDGQNPRDVNLKCTSLEENICILLYFVVNIILHDLSNDKSSLF